MGAIRVAIARNKKMDIDECYKARDRERCDGIEARNKDAKQETVVDNCQRLSVVPN